MTWIKMRKIRPVIIGAHPSFYDKMELIRKEYQKAGIKLSQVQLTNIIGKKIRIPKINLGLKRR